MTLKAFYLLSVIVICPSERQKRSFFIGKNLHFLTLACRIYRITESILSTDGHSFARCHIMLIAIHFYFKALGLIFHFSETKKISLLQKM